MKITDFSRYNTMMKIADKVETVAGFEVPAGVIMTTAVSLQKIAYSGLEDLEISWVVVRDSNPPVIVVHTEDEAEAHRAYADEIDRARKTQSERTMWRR